jgi:hypothetical protein
VGCDLRSFFPGGDMDHFSTHGYARDNDVLACTSHKSLNF